MQLVTLALCVLLLVIANAAPIVARMIFHTRWNHPVDGGACFADQRPVFGTTKTWRGIVSSLLLTSLFSQVFGLGALLGAAIAALAMLGDLSASFVKRRLGIGESGRAWLLDQIPESLLPLLLLQEALGLSLAEVAMAVVLFTLVDMGLSPLLYRLHVRNRPY